MHDASKPYLRDIYGCPLSILLLLTAFPVCAELGGDAGSVEADRVHMNAEVRMQRATKFSVHELQTPGGTTIREYVAPTGRVFAVAWTGPQMPDLQQLFGGYFESLKKAASRKPSERGPLRIDEPTLVVDSGGHMRAFHGRAYDPRLVPADVFIAEIQ